MTDKEKCVVCKNCDNEFTGNYCNNCGQSAKDYDRPFSVLIVDAMANIWAFDTRLWTTLKSILLKPGEMAINYITGKRIRYMPPFRLYLFISFIFFMLLRISANSESNTKIISFNNDSDKGVDKELIQGGEIVRERENKASIAEIDNIDKESVSEQKSKSELAISNFITYLSWALIIMMPLYASLLWVLFRKRQKHYLAHFIFALNQHAFLFIILSILIILTLAFPDKSSSYEAWLLMLFPAYLVVGGRTLYKARWRSIIIRMFAAFILYMIIVISIIILVVTIIFHQLN
ncbi:MAG: DUF3667 domain-containing protein [Bacteroidales bacterium]|jgi:hypothetical protein|nr:DUF3667 domain-containing protein [Bacteroidales bacterium]MDD3273135.1 DUF3667 domain-containing protein [Bacteroidales bacterium]MDD4058115.1 DUF3667 domain-containing protein [Bacteroidales bacterium]